jgi:hypothetical protein
LLLVVIPHFLSTRLLPLCSNTQCQVGFGSSFGAERW